MRENSKTVEGREYRQCAVCMEWKEKERFAVRGRGRQGTCWACNKRKRECEDAAEREERAQRNANERERYSKRTEAGLTERGKKVRETVEKKRKRVEARIVMEKMVQERQNRGR